MMTVLKMPIRNLSPAELRDLQAKYPDATLRVEAETALRDEGMDESQFWAIMALLDWRTLDSEAILTPAVQALSQFSEADIHRFHDMLNEKLYALDGQRFAEQLGSNRYEPNQHFSVDSFLYARCCVVANGRNFYEAVLNDPSRMPKEFTFESLLYLPKLAWTLKTGQDDYNYYPEIWSETFSNPDGWEGITPLKDRFADLS